MDFELWEKIEKRRMVSGATMPLTIFVLILVVKSEGYGSWVDHCKQGGQCSSLIESYESLVMGTECRKLYVTGECSQLCTYSLRALISRKMWTRCGKMCDWGDAVIASAESWLALCLDRPSKEVRHPDTLESQQHNKNISLQGSGGGNEGQNGNGKQIHADGDENGGSVRKVSDRSGRRILRRSGIVLSLVVLAVVVNIILMMSSRSFRRNSFIGMVFRRLPIPLRRWIRAMSFNSKLGLPDHVTSSDRKSSTSVGMVVDGPMQYRVDSRARRGARRHLAGI